MPKKSEKLTIYYDGTCPMCTAFKSQSEKNTNREEIEFLDVHSATIPNFLSKEELLIEMKVVDSYGNIISGSDSIFAVLRKHKWLFWLGYLGSLPIIKQCARPIYRAISAQRYFIFGSSSRIFWIRIVTIIGLLIGLLLSLPLWVGDRIIPLVPVVDLAVPESISIVLFLLLLGNLLWALISSRPQLSLLLAFLLLGLLVLLDQNRLQPWVYQYGAILLLLSSYSWKPQFVTEQERVLNVLRLMAAGIYFYSGLQKVNPVFMFSVMPWMLEPFVSEEYFTLSMFVGLVVPFIEMFIGIGLLFKSTRLKALIGVFAMLIFVLLCLGPVGHNWNYVVWPWNIAFALLAFILFWRCDKSIFQILSVPKTVSSLSLVALFMFFPILFFFGKWDGYPSFSLYSGQVATLRIVLPATLDVPKGIVSYIIEDKEGNIVFSPTRFAMNDIYVPIYPETRVHRAVVGEFCKLFQNNEKIKIQFVPSLYWVKNHNLPTYSCTDVK